MLQNGHCARCSNAAFLQCSQRQWGHCLNMPGLNERIHLQFPEQRGSSRLQRVWRRRASSPRRRPQAYARLSRTRTDKVYGRGRRTWRGVYVGSVTFIQLYMGLRGEEIGGPRHGGRALHGFAEDCCARTGSWSPVSYLGLATDYPHTHARQLRCFNAYGRVHVLAQ